MSSKPSDLFPVGGEMGRTPADLLANWSGRLVQRNYADLAKPAWPRQYSARIEHDGIGFYFPLGSDDRLAAARKACEIHSHVTAKGWPATFRRYPREITLSIFWRRRPLVCTYTTLYTEPWKKSPPASSSHRSSNGSRPVVVIESDPQIRATIEEMLERTPGCRCAGAFARAGEALRSRAIRSASLCLFNQHLPDIADIEFVKRLGAVAPHLPVYSFGIYEESDDIFISISGVAEGYFLLRRPPARMLDPLHALWKEGISSAEDLDAGITRYFQERLAANGEAQPHPDAGALTSREREVLNCLRKGYSDKLIADALAIRPSTVHTHLKRIFEKLGVHTRTEAVMKYLQK